ncbi:MAG: cyclic nucleotide-binding domain-containing protein [Spirochaetaceae bacterium]|jgi:anti-sigma regulatory factor (Ser/Thr protein kinase)|nr:cyclic nucleotide-binding domain-containing protein [Spirochaetaceae bacterium]
MIVVINSDAKIHDAILSSLLEAGIKANVLRFVSTEDNLIDIVKFYFPEIIIINLSDPRLNVEMVMTAINQDRRFLSFGVIGVFSVGGKEEDQLVFKYRNSQIVTFLENYRIRTNLGMVVNIIKKNYQFVFQSDFANNIKDGCSGSILVENDIQCVSSYTGIISTMLVSRGIIMPDDKMQLQLALEELIVNAIEHGNCSITYDEKTKGMAEGKSVVDLVAERNKDPQIAAKKVEVLWDIQKNQTVLSVIDQGRGFDVKSHLDVLRRQDKFSFHGRGIKIASSLVKEVRYNKKGNKVSLIFNNKNAEIQMPPGLMVGQPFNVKIGDVIIREGEESDCLFYIISGRYGVYVENKYIDVITPDEIFMGEMAFILNENRTATVVAETSGKLVRIDRKIFVRIVREYPHYIMFLSRLITQRLLRRKTSFY